MADVLDPLLPIRHEEEREGAELPEPRVGRGEPAAGEVAVVLLDLKSEGEPPVVADPGDDALGRVKGGENVYRRGGQKVYRMAGA